MNNKYKVGDNNYISDFEQMRNLGIDKIDKERRYWLASRDIYPTSMDVAFMIRCVTKSGDREAGSVNTLMDIGTRDGDHWGVDSYSYSYGLRVVFRLSPYTKVIMGEGTEESPYELRN